MSGTTPFQAVDADVSPALLPLAAQQAVTVANTVTVTQPGAELAYKEFTAAVSITATTEGTANTIVTAPAVTFDGTTIVIVQFFCPSVSNPSAALLTICLYEDGASIGQAALEFGSSSTVVQTPIRVDRRLTPTGGSHTFSVCAFVASGTGTVSGGVGGSGAAVPGFIRIISAA